MSENNNNNNSTGSENKSEKEHASFSPNTPLVEGKDYYMENGMFVLTEYYLNKRGYCCNNGCRHCPYRSGYSELK